MVVTQSFGSSLSPLEGDAIGDRGANRAAYPGAAVSAPPIRAGKSSKESSARHENGVSRWQLLSRRRDSLPSMSLSLPTAKETADRRDYKLG